MTWAGADFVECAVFVGPPNAGSLDALERLVEGYQPSFLLPRYPPAIVGTLPAAYQLLPRGRHGVLLDHASQEPIEGLLDPRLWRERGWGLADPNERGVLAQLLPDVEGSEERRRIALDHQAKCLTRAEAVARALDVPAPPPVGTELLLFCGDAIDTLAQVAADGAGKLTRTRHDPGDGTVLRTSALLDERAAVGWRPRVVTPIEWASVWFLFTDHLGVTRDPVFVDNVLYLLLEAPRR